MKIKIDKYKWMTAAMYGVFSTLLLLAAVNAAKGEWLTAFCNVIWCGMGYINILFSKRLSRAHWIIIEQLELNDKMLQLIKELRSIIASGTTNEEENDTEKGDKAVR